MLKLIQLGLTLHDGEGKLPELGGELCVWQFNFKEFNLEKALSATAVSRQGRIYRKTLYGDFCRYES